MSDLAKITAPSKADTARLLATMFVGKFSPHGGQFTPALVSEYVEQLAGFPLAIVSKVVQDVRSSGEKFAPFPGELAQLCRDETSKSAADVARIQAENKEVADRLAWEAARAARTPEAIERQKQAYADFKAAVGDRAAEEAKERQVRSAAHYERVHKRFDRHAREVLLKTLERQEKERAAIDE
jgi:hypothetical protein